MEQNKTIDWNGFKSDAEVETKLKEIIREIRMSSMKNRTKEEVQEEIKKYIKSKGFPFADSISVSVSEPDQMGSRMGMLMTHSPASEDTINLSF